VHRQAKFDVWLAYVWILTLVTWLLTLMAAFAVRGIEAISILGIAIVYSILNRFKVKRQVIRVVMAILLVLAAGCVILLVYEIVTAYHAAPRP